MTRLVDFRYRQYLDSPQWRAKRAQRLEHDNHTCTRCPATTGLEVHHILYDRLGHERLSDLATLCGDCHRKEHGHDITLAPAAGDHQATLHRVWAYAWKEQQEAWATAAHVSEQLDRLFELLYLDENDGRVRTIRGSLQSLIAEFRAEMDEIHWNDQENAA